MKTHSERQNQSKAAAHSVEQNKEGHGEGKSLAPPPLQFTAAPVPPDPPIQRNGEDEAESQETIEEAKGPTTSGTLDVDAQRTRGRGELKRVNESEDGTKTETSGAVTVSEKGVNLGVKHSKTTPEEPGLRPKTTRSTAIDADITKGKIGATHSVKTGEKGNETTTSVGGSATVNKDGISGANVSRKKKTSNGTSFNTSFGYKVDIKSPVEDYRILEDGTSSVRYKVSGKLTWNAGFGVDKTKKIGQNTDLEKELAKEDIYKAKSLKINGSVSVGQVRTFVQYFDSEQAANDYVRHAKRHFNLHSWQEFGQPGSAVDAANLGVGEQRGNTTKAGISGGLGGNLGNIQLGVDLGFGREHAIRVTKPDENHVIVSLRTLNEVSGGASLGGPFVSMGIKGSIGGIAGSTFLFDITPPEKPGWIALEFLLRRGTVPEGSSGPGWRRTETRTGTKRSSGVDLSMLGVSGSTSGTLEEEQITSETGEKTNIYTGTRESAVSGLFGGSGSESAQVTTETGKGATFNFVFAESDAAATNEAIAKATGTYADYSGVEGARSGTWHFSFSLSEAELRSFFQGLFIQERYSKGFAKAAIGNMSNVSEVRELKEEIRTIKGDRPWNEISEKDLDPMRRELADYIRSAMATGVALVRGVLGKQPNYDIRLEGGKQSRAFLGKQGRQRLLARVEKLQQRFQRRKNIEALFSEIRGVYRAHERRLKHQRDGDQLQDLPSQIREKEIAANQKIMDILEPLFRDARTALRRSRKKQTAQDVEMAASQEIARETGEGPQSSEESHSRANEMRDEKSPLVSAMEGDEAAMWRKKRVLDKMYNTVRTERWIHKIGPPGNVGNKKAAKKYLDGYFFYGSEYNTIEESWQEAKKYKDIAEQRKQDFQAEKNHLPSEIEGITPNLRRLIMTIRRLSWEYCDANEAAQKKLIVMAKLYKQIRKEKPDREYWGDSKFRPPSPDYYRKKT